MNPKTYTFDEEQKLPTECTKEQSLCDVDETAEGGPKLVLRPVTSGKPMVRVSTGERGFLLRGVIHKGGEEWNPKKITTEEVIAVQGKDKFTIQCVCDEWIPEIFENVAVLRQAMAAYVKELAGEKETLISAAATTKLAAAIEKLAVELQHVNTHLADIETRLATIPRLKEKS